MTASLTMTDPEFLKEPFTAEKKWQAVPNGRVMTYECTEPDWLDLLDRLMSARTRDDSAVSESKRRKHA